MKNSQKEYSIYKKIVDFNWDAPTLGRVCKLREKTLIAGGLRTLYEAQELLEQLSAEVVASSLAKPTITDKKRSGRVEIDGQHWVDIVYQIYP